ncbi:NAD(P)/FAD-dependent oxidoreductase [Nocardioides sp. KIGAM211]|uniref:NAD(P)/FAD-dependent oxidoreductase n=1 Tax=Nocardioides luti TaxID=2761101 RepID=A0A7X0VB28_9ACTN|nr:bifunctional NAD(P)/FAD-dependent oxidoreductase/class I SAM-dependent methyltransferase [Nocardioides luti]MBB6628409.1 NAD(P)/FAD-dependent oxidoreductase [Nocardioides luti]
MTQHEHGQPAQTERHDQTEQHETYDVVVIGGGAAGLSGAVALARSRRRVLVVDAGEPRNAPAAGVHNYLGREGVSPAELLATGRAELASYGGEVRASRVDAVRAWDRDGTGFVVTLADGAELAARRLLVATGLVDELPDLPGLAERWGRDVLHCPYCHGFEVRDRAIGILWRGPASLHHALMFRQLSDDVVVLLDGHAAPEGEVAEQLAAFGVRVVAGSVAEVVVEDDRLTGVRLADGEVVARDALVVAPRFTARSPLLESLGVEPVDQLMGDTVVGSHYPHQDPSGTTSVPGVWVAGNVTELMAQVMASAAAGLMAGARINYDLIEEDAAVAVEHRRALLAMFDQASWEERYAAGSAIWSGNPNPQLVAEASGLAPGRALDIGSGEGADVLWLAGQGWQVTGLDFSQVALDRSAAHAAAAGAEVADRCTWRQADLRAWVPGAGDLAAYDLVTSQFFHLPDRGMLELVPRLAETVAPGGTLLVVGHHPSDLHGGHRWGAVDMMFTPEDLVPLLDPGVWEVEVAETRARQVPAHGDADGDAHEDAHAHDTVHDAVLRARRR